jgi:flagellar protein FliS
MSPADVYLQNIVENANPIQLVIMLYDKAIHCIETAIEAIESGLDEPENVKSKAENLTRAMDILIVLRASLDEEKGKEISKNLGEIYEILIDEIVRANMKNDVEILKKIKEVLEDLRGAWEEAEKNVYEKHQG